MSRPTVTAFASTSRVLSLAVDTLRPATGVTARRLASTSAPAAAGSSYPFNPTALSIPSTVPSSSPPTSLTTPRNGWSLITHLSRSALLSNPSPYTSLFSRHDPSRLRTGSVLTVLQYTDSTRRSITPFSGVLMGVYRTQNPTETSFKLRNIVNKSGVEMKFKLYSPLIKEIKIVKKAQKTGPIKDLKRAKVTYLRERPSIMASIAGAIKASKR